jgi:serine/threonine protein phosphatase PrpC
MVGHTGDCRIVLSEKGGIARDLTIDHKPINASEKEVYLNLINVFFYTVDY